MAPMTGLAFLLIAIVISVVGSLVLWWRSRDPVSLESGIEDFSREMRALAPDRGEAASRPTRRR